MCTSIWLYTFELSGNGIQQIHSPGPWCLKGGFVRLSFCEGSVSRIYMFDQPPSTNSLGFRIPRFIKLSSDYRRLMELIERSEPELGAGSRVVSMFSEVILGSYSTLFVYSLGDILMNEVLFCTGQRSVPRAISCSVVNGTEPRNAAVELDRPLMVVRFLWNYRSQQQKHALKYLEIRISNGNTLSQCQ